MSRRKGEERDTHEQRDVRLSKVGQWQRLGAFVPEQKTVFQEAPGREWTGVELNEPSVARTRSLPVATVLGEVPPGGPAGVRPTPPSEGPPGAAGGVSTRPATSSRPPAHRPGPLGSLGPSRPVPRRPSGLWLVWSVEAPARSGRGRQPWREEGLGTHGLPPTGRRQWGTGTAESETPGVEGLECVVVAPQPPTTVRPFKVVTAPPRPSRRATRPCRCLQ